MKHTLSNGIEIEDCRQVQCGVIVTNEDIHKGTLTWFIDRFVVIPRGRRLESEAEIDQEIANLTELKQALKEANELIKWTGKKQNRK